MSAAPAHPAPRGRHKVLLGMAAGVGKTYAMLEEGHALREGGADVVVGLLETHGRALTAERAEGLTILPRRSIDYRGTLLEEMDLPGILHRAPGTCLIDELAHTNAPGVEHPKRYDDVEDVLAAGIDVVSTMNVQHLESLNDLVTELTGVRVRETVPDAVLARADDIVLVDLTPEELLHRLRAGHVYPQQRIEAALNGFFTVENLVSLREVALRQVAEAVGAQRINRIEVTGRGHASREASPAVAEHLLALVRPRAADQRIIRRAWRSAQRLGAPLDVVWVRSDHDLDAEGERQLRAMRQLCSLLGSELHVVDGDDVVLAVREFVAERGTTYLLIGRPHDARALERLRDPLAMRLVRALDGVDVRVVATRHWPGDEEDRA